jgi:hypothetical protein
MGGGFDGIPFEVNLKCLYISGGLAVAHEVLPRGVSGAVIVMILSYVGLSYYDALHMCDLKLSANTILHPLTASVKPPVDSEGNYSYDG